MMPSQQSLGRWRKYRYNIGSIIYTIRQKRGIGQSKAAQEIGVNLYTVNRVENRGTIPNRPQYAKMMNWIRRHEWA